VRKQSLNSTWVDSFEEFKGAIDDCLGKMTTVHKQDAATLFVHRFQQFENVSVLAAWSITAANWRNCDARGGVAEAWVTDARKVAHFTDPSACTPTRLQQSPLARLNGSQAVAGIWQ